MNILNDTTLNVNTNTEDLLNYFVDNILNSYELSYVPFYELINNDIVIEEDKKKHKKAFQDSRLNKQVPNIHKSMVRWVIKNKFDNDEQAYINSIPLFFDRFSIKDKKIADDNMFETDKRKRKSLNKKKKHLILYSSQLLKLIGCNRPSIATNDMVNAYREEMRQQDEYLKSFRLVSANGKITKLVSNEVKQRQRMAQILKISKCMENIAKDKKFTFSFITLTLPSHFHPNPMNGNCSFSGATPQEAINQLNHYWKLIRARLSKLGYVFGEDLFGIQVIECQADSTLHLHCCLWHSKKKIDIKNIHNEIKEVREEFDIRLNNGKASASSYLFKYVLKTHTDYKDSNVNDEAIKNMTARHLYGIRSFNFFGLKGSITKFNFLCKNYLNYKKYLSKEIKFCLQQGDLYDFITNYEMFFDNAYFTEMGSKKLLGVIFKKGQYELDGQLLKQKDIIKYNEIVLIENKQYCVFEKTYEEEFKYIRQIDLTLPEYANVKASFDKVCIKQVIFEEQKSIVLQSLGFQEAEIKQEVDIKRIPRSSTMLNNWLKKVYESSTMSHNSNELQLFNIIQEKPALRVKYLEDDEYDMILLE